MIPGAQAAAVGSGSRGKPLLVTPAFAPTTKKMVDEHQCFYSIKSLSGGALKSPLIK